LNYDPSGSSLRTECVEPFSPAPPGGPAGPDLLVNGSFAAPFEAPWGLFGQINGAVHNGVFEFVKLPGTPGGVVLQPTTLGMALNQFLTAQMDLGNSSAVRKRVTVLVHDADFSDLAACTFWLPPGLPLSTYQMRLRVTKAWTNATLSIYPATTGLDQWIRLDNVSLRRTPGLDINGTECFEPGEALPPPSISSAMAIGRSAPPAPRWFAGSQLNRVVGRRPTGSLALTSGAPASCIAGGPSNSTRRPARHSCSRHRSPEAPA
jgi:hypothetical protein